MHPLPAAWTVLSEAAVSCDDTDESVFSEFSLFQDIFQDVTCLIQPQVGTSEGTWWALCTLLWRALHRILLCLLSILDHTCTLMKGQAWRTHCHLPFAFQQRGSRPGQRLSLLNIVNPAARRVVWHSGPEVTGWRDKAGMFTDGTKTLKGGRWCYVSLLCIWLIICTNNSLEVCLSRIPPPPALLVWDQSSSDTDI